jgi:hypothetical protein
LRFLSGLNIMANGTTTVGEEEFKPSLPERVGEERGSLTGLARDWFTRWITKNSD